MYKDTKKHKMLRKGKCRPCGIPLEIGTEVIRTVANGGQDSQVYICMSCGRDIAKIVLAEENLDEFGQEIVMGKLSDES